MPQGESPALTKGGYPHTHRLSLDEEGESSLARGYVDIPPGEGLGALRGCQGSGYDPAAEIMDEGECAQHGLLGEPLRDTPIAGNGLIGAGEHLSSRSEPSYGRGEVLGTLGLEDGCPGVRYPPGWLDRPEIALEVGNMDQGRSGAIKGALRGRFHRAW